MVDKREAASLLEDDHELDIPEGPEEAQARRELYAVLRRVVKNTEGKLLVRSVRDRNPYDVWRRLVFRFDPDITDKEAVDTEHILSTKQAANMKEVQGKISEWEEKMRVYMKTSGTDPLNPGVQRVKLMFLFSPTLKQYIHDQLLTSPQMTYMYVKRLALANVKATLARQDTGQHLDACGSTEGGGEDEEDRCLENGDEWEEEYGYHDEGRPPDSLGRPKGVSNGKGKNGTGKRTGKEMLAKANARPAPKAQERPLPHHHHQQEENEGRRSRSGSGLAATSAPTVGGQVIGNTSVQISRSQTAHQCPRRLTAKCAKAVLGPLAWQRSLWTFHGHLLSVWCFPLLPPPCRQQRRWPNSPRRWWS